MKIHFRPDHSMFINYATDQDKIDYKIKIPQTQNRLKRGTGSSCFDPAEWMEFNDKPYKYLLYIDMSLKKAFAIPKDLVLNQVKIKLRHNVRIYITEVRPIIEAGHFEDLSYYEY